MRGGSYYRKRAGRKEDVMILVTVCLPVSSQHHCVHEVHPSIYCILCTFIEVINGHITSNDAYTNFVLVKVNGLSK